jgi:hypothetical protein
MRYPELYVKLLYFMKVFNFFPDLLNSVTFSNMNMAR